ARNAAEPTGSDVFRVFFSSLMCLVLYYLLYKASLCTFGLAHAIYLILLFLEEVKPQRHILAAATVLLATIVFTSGDHPYETLNKFVWLVTQCGCFRASHHFSSTNQCCHGMGWLASFLPFRYVVNLYRLAFRNDMLAIFHAPATIVFGRLDGVDS
ncbi:hypothetical protein Tco_1543299, partial [Tanacetum coccineum]